ncbi:MAG: YbaK/EbsC family protein [Acidimicrobiales bacterium]
MHRRVTHFAAALEHAGGRAQVRELEASTRTARDAAAALGCSVGAIANSLVFMSDGQPILVLSSGAHRVDTEFVAAVIRAKEVRPATPDEVRLATGQPIGGVAPLGHPAPLPTYIDRTLRDFETIWAAAGTPHAVFPTSFAELQRITEGTAIEVVSARPE